MIISHAQGPERGPEDIGRTSFGCNGDMNVRRDDFPGWSRHAGIRATGLLMVAIGCLMADVVLSQEPAPAQLPIPAIKPASKSTNWGTGFVVRDGYVITALHVILNHNNVLLGPVASGRWVQAELVQSDAKLDLALLKARIDLPPLSLAPSADVPTGLEVSVIGYPQPKFQGLGKKITHGIVNGYLSERQHAQDIGYLQISAEVSQGNSGGPVLAPDGTVIGMVQRKIDAKKVAEQSEDLLINVNYALRSSQIIKFLQSGPASPQIQSLSLAAVLRPFQIFDKTQASVLAVIGRDVASASSVVPTP